MSSAVMPASRNSTSTPERMAALASWISLTSSRLIEISRPWPLRSAGTSQESWLTVLQVQAIIPFAESSPTIQDICPAQFCHRIQNTRTANADGWFALDGMDLYGISLETDPLNCTRDGANALADVGAFKGWPGGARAGEMPALMDQADLGIGADIQRHHGLLEFCCPGCQQHGHMVPTDKTGDIGRQVNRSAGRHLQSNFSRGYPHG